MSGTASAGTNQVGTIGSQASPVDLESEDINNADTITTQDIDVSQNVNGANTSTAASGEALTSDGTGGLTFASVGGGVPKDFSYTDKTNSRSFDTLFTNNTGSALYVLIALSQNVSGDDLNVGFEINGNFLGQMGNRLGSRPDILNFTLDFFVPDGGTYEVLDISGTAFLISWNEAEL